MSGSKEKILEASGEVLRKNGLDRITIDEIASTASVSKATIYKYFNGKDHIIMDYVGYVIGKDKEIWVKIIEKESNPESTLRDFGINYILYISNPITVHVFKVVVCFFDRAFGREEFCYSLLPSGVLTALEAKFDTWRSHGEFVFADSGLLARQFLAMLRGSVYPTIMHDPAFTIDRGEAQKMVDQTIGVLLYGVAIEQESNGGKLHPSSQPLKIGRATK